MPELDLEELEKLAAAATPGPWTEGRHDMKSIVEGCPAKYIYSPLQAVAIACGEDVAWYQVICNAEYIVAACNAVPELIKRVRELEKKLSQVTYRHDEMAKLYSEYHDENSTLKERLAELATENSNQKRVIQMLEYRVLELKGKPIPMEPRLPTCDALYHPRAPLHSNRSNAKEAGE